MRGRRREGPDGAPSPGDGAGAAGNRGVVLLVSSVASLEGGAERSLLELARRLPAAGWRPALAVWSDGSLADAFRDEGLSVFVRRPGGRDPASPLGGLAAGLPWLSALIRPLNSLRLALRPTRGEAAWLARTARASGARLLHTNCDLSLPAAARAAAETGLPRVSHVRDRTRSWLHPRFLRALRSADAVVTPGEGLARRLHERGVKARAVPDPVSPEPFLHPLGDEERRKRRRELGIGEDRFAAAALGRLEEAKGTWDLIRAAERLVAAGEPLVLVLAGRGHPALEAELEKRIASAGLDEGILRLGWRDDVARWLPAMDAVVAPGRGESFGRTVVEGMASGLPVVASDDGGAAEVLVHEETGLLVPPADAEALAAALRRLIREPGLRRELGCSAREWVRAAFDPDANARATARVYEELVSARGRATEDET